MPSKNFGFGLVLCGKHPHPGGWYSDDNGQWVTCMECKRLNMSKTELLQTLKDILIGSLYIKTLAKGKGVITTSVAYDNNIDGRHCWRALVVTDDYQPVGSSIDVVKSFCDLSYKEIVEFTIMLNTKVRLSLCDNLSVKLKSSEALDEETRKIGLKHDT
jgi:hypothetical protein